jgi:hypothetical protein
MWGSDYPHSESTFLQSCKMLAQILAGVPDDEQAKPAPDRIRGSPAATRPRVQFGCGEADRSCLKSQPLRIDEPGAPALLIGRCAHCRTTPAARGSCGAKGNYKGYCNSEIEAVYGFTCCSRGLTSSKSITPFQ